MSVSPTFIKRFNQAAALAREGKYEEALEAYEKINDLFDNPEEARMMTGEFMGMIELRKAYCLMDLERYEETRQLFESDILRAALGQFNKETLYDYFFSYGNVLGYLGLIEEMGNAMTKALNIAAEELDDLKRCENVWYWIMYCAKEHGEWKYLEEQCINAHKFGVKNESHYLQHIAGQFGCYAYRGLGKIDEARRGAEVILGRMRAAKAAKENIKEWEDFLESLDE